MIMIGTKLKFYFNNVTWIFVQIRSSGLCLFVSVYFSLFLIAILVLFTPIFRDIRSANIVQINEYNIDYEDSVYVIDGADDGRLPKWLESFAIWNETFQTAKKFSRTGLKFPFSKSKFDYQIDCNNIEEITDLEFIAAGWTKAVYRGMFRGQPIAVKTVFTNGHDMQKCLKKNSQDINACYRRSAAKILKELILLNELPHDNLVKVIGSCIPYASGPVIVATELGEPLDVVKVLQLPWEQRLKLSHHIAKILHHFAHSHLGSLAMNDLRRQQFVLVGDTLKLSDIDDVGLSEPKCSSDNDCVLRNLKNNTIIENLSCVYGICKGYNERLNIWRAGEHFIRQFLPIEVPPRLEYQVKKIVDAYSRNSSWDTEDILLATENLSKQFRRSDQQSYLDITSREAVTSGKEKPIRRKRSSVLLKPR